MYDKQTVRAEVIASEIERVDAEYHDRDVAGMLSPRYAMTLLIYRQLLQSELAVCRLTGSEPEGGRHG